MDIGVEISLYPLDADYIPTIKGFIDRLNTHAELRIVTNSLSTQVFGSFDAVFAALKQEFGTTFLNREREAGKAVFVMKVIGPLAQA